MSRGDVIRSARVDIVAGDALSAIPAAGWRASASALLPGAATARPDARWRTHAAVATLDGVPVGALALHQAKAATFPTPTVDPHALHPELFAAASADAFLLLGSPNELVAGVAIAAHLDTADAVHIGRSLVAAGFAEATRRGLVGAALYVRAEELDRFADGARQLARTEEFATLTVGRRWPEDYLAGLNHGRRSVVVRDWRHLRDRGLAGAPEPAEDLVAVAAELVVAVKRRHGVADHPRLAALRLSAWAARGPGRALAFAVRDGAGRTRAVSFGRHWGEVLELYEIGLDESDDRHLAYAEALVYAPMRYATAAGCTRVDLGLGSPRPKDLRGAHRTPVWTVRGRPTTGGSAE